MLLKTIFILIFCIYTTSSTYANLVDFNNLPAGKTVSGAGIFDDFLIHSPGDGNDIKVVSGAFNNGPDDLSIVDGGSEYSGNSNRFNIDFTLDDVGFVSFDISGQGGEDFGMTVVAHDVTGQNLTSDSAHISPLDGPGEPGHGNRIVDSYDWTTHNWTVNFTLTANNIQSVSLVYYPYFDLSLDNLSYETVAAPVPEPATLYYIGIGLLGLIIIRRRNKSTRSISGAV